MKALWQVVVLVSAVMAFSSVASESELDTDRVDFSGKTITFIVPYMDGGGTDAWTRLVAPHLKRHLPGNPDIVISNVPGSNATKAANAYAESAAADGLEVLVTAASNQLSYILGDSRVRYDFSNWRALLAYRPGLVVYTSDQMGVSDIYQLVEKKNKHLIMASMGPTSDDIFVLLAFKILDMKMTAIFGSPGRGPARNIFLRGEANIDAQTTVSYMTHVKPDELAGKAIPLFTMGAFDQQMNYIRDPMFPDLPNVEDVYRHIYGVAPQGEAWEALLALYRASYGSLKILVLPKKTPQTIVDVYNDAIRHMLEDPDFKSQVKDMQGDLYMLSGAEADALLEARAPLPDKYRQWIMDWIFERYGVRL